MSKKKLQQIAESPTSDVPPSTVQRTPNDGVDRLEKERGRGEIDTRENPRVEANKERSQRGRVPLGALHHKLSLEAYADQLEGFVPRWINDIPGRIQQAIKGGYEPILRNDIKVGDGEDLNQDMGTWVSEIVGRHEGTNQPMLAYAMKIRKEWYDEDQKAKLKPVDEVEAAIRNTGLQSNQGDNSNSYVKTANISTNRK